MKTVHDLIPLTQIATGATGKVAQVVGSPGAVHRLEEMGLRDGAAVEVVKSGTPCIVRINGQKLCFRDGEALGILVRLGIGA